MMVEEKEIEEKMDWHWDDIVSVVCPVGRKFFFYLPMHGLGDMGTYVDCSLMCGQKQEVSEEECDLTYRF